MVRQSKKFDIRLKRAYVPPSAEDGVRVLVDRLWPRGVRKSDAAIDRWAKEIAPSTELRRWFGHDPARWDEFQRCYKAELSGVATNPFDMAFYQLAIRQRGLCLT
jgi:uncharacterized protein YeaO (DUF488 family)